MPLNSMFRSLLAAMTLLAVVALPSTALTALDAPLADGCVRATLDAAATALVSEQSSADGTSTVQGLHVGHVTDWRIAPGIDTTLLRVGDQWCTTDSFNAAAAEHLTGATDAQAAMAFASVAATPFLGQVAVTDVANDNGTITLTTTGGRHGATSSWAVIVDDQGVREATFTTTGWTAALDGSIGSFEGVTSLPGHTRSFARDAAGLVRIDASLDDLMAAAQAERPAALANAAEIAGLAPGDDLAHTFEDGYTIHISYGMSPYTPDVGIDTGVAQADRLRSLHRGMIANYGDFVRWGVDNPFGATSRTFLGSQWGLPYPHGYINVDSPMAPVCLACAYLTDAMEIHVAYFFPEIAPPLVGISYPDTEQFFNGVIGHEMVHSLQGGYSDGTAGSLTNAFTEGSARASESLHDDAYNTHQTGSIMYIDSSNGCEGFENGRGGWIAAQAAGPFSGHTYDACYFWLTYYATHGPEGLTSLLEALPAATAGDGNTVQRNLRLLDAAAADGNGTLDLARWAAAYTAGSTAHGYTIPAGQTGESFDWFGLFDPADRAANLADSQNVVLGGGGTLAYRVTADRVLGPITDGAVAHAFDIVDGSLVPTEVAEGAELRAGQILTLAPAGSDDVSGVLTTTVSE